MEPYILLNCFPIWKAMERWQEREKDIWLFKNSLCFISIPLYVRHQDIFTVVNNRTWFLPSWSLLSEEKKKKNLNLDRESVMSVFYDKGMQSLL